MKIISERLARAKARYLWNEAKFPRGYFAYQREADAWVKKLLARHKPPDDDFVHVGNRKYSRCEWARACYNFIHRYEQPYDESKHKRIPKGQRGAGRYTFKDRPSSSGPIYDDEGRFVGHFDLQTGWVTRSVKIGGSRSDDKIERAVADIDDVLDAMSDDQSPTSSDSWGDWFIKEGHPATAAEPKAPSYQDSDEQTESDDLLAIAGDADSDEFAPKAPVDRPESSCAVHDQQGRFIGHFDIGTGWVTRVTKTGGKESDYQLRRTVADIDDVLKAIWDYEAPSSVDEWNDWFIREWSSSFVYRRDPAQSD